MNSGKWKHGPKAAVCPSWLILSHTQGAWFSQESGTEETPLFLDRGLGQMGMSFFLWFRGRFRGRQKNTLSKGYPLRQTKICSSAQWRFCLGLWNHPQKKPGTLNRQRSKANPLPKGELIRLSVHQRLLSPNEQMQKLRVLLHLVSLGVPAKKNGLVHDPPSSSSSRSIVCHTGAHRFRDF